MRAKNPTYSLKHFLFLIGTLGIAMLLALYIFQVNALTSVVYTMGDQEQTLKDLEKRNQAMDTKRLQSISRERMEAMAELLQFERISHVTYLKVPTSTVARTSGQE